jgi:uncharacterized protein (TIGR00369 family)
MLGMRVEEIADGHVRLALPFREANANPGGALHGGCAASLAVVGAGALARAAQGEDAGPWHTGAIQIGYLAAAVGEDVVADARLLRRGRELCFAEVAVTRGDGRPVAHAAVAVRGGYGAAAEMLPVAAGDEGAADPGRMGPAVEKLGFIAARGIQIEHMSGGTSRLRMPFQSGDADAAGGVHEGAALALFDTAGAMAAWAETGPGRFKASTSALQAQVLAPPDAELVAYGRLAARDREIFFSDVEVAEAARGRVVARGTVIYRIVT